MAFIVTRAAKVASNATLETAARRRWHTPGGGSSVPSGGLHLRFATPTWATQAPDVGARFCLPSEDVVLQHGLGCTSPPFARRVLAAITGPWADAVPAHR
eukprot:CAMPEP_0197930216 /NCGR_PEP_ID=MMETSP1439-20131203/105093_1 /TAXON_ID=66791 /ORGANISM="Gonyaulax spinifera, Strain CCMP409" /LENGTH=99 /DNA_ID=CAMNT_0043552901 /DNA_START=154 /DNA_END=450 /DNA_ORIENTATION=-